MLQFSMQLKILIFAIPFLIIIILHFVPGKKKKEDDGTPQSVDEEKESNAMRD